MPTSNPLRLDAALVDAASAVAARHKRTVPRQIEHWAELGRVLEAMVDPAALLALQQGLARLVIEMAPSRPVDPSEVFANLERAREEGSLPQQASEARVRYQASAAVPGRLEQVHADGRRVIGDFRGGEFVPSDDSSS